jgi:transcription antitermination protein NusB
MIAGLPAFEPDDEVQIEEIAPSPPATERSLARQMALQALYEIDSARHPADEVVARCLDTTQPERQVARYVKKLVDGILEYYTTIDDAIVKYAPEFPLDQIAVIDRNILRIAIYEFAVSARVPVSAAINEAVELAKLFGAEGAAAFINGVLGAVADDAALMQELAQASDEEE